MATASARRARDESIKIGRRGPFDAVTIEPASATQTAPLIARIFFRHCAPRLDSGPSRN